MAMIQKITIPVGVATLIVTGNGMRVLLSVANVFIGDSSVNRSNGIFITGSFGDYVDLGKVANGENIYVFSDLDNEATVFYYNTV